MKKLYGWQILTALVLTLMAACTGNHNLNDASVVAPAETMLSFKNWDEFHQTVSKMGTLSESEQRTYEASKGGFVSMRSLFKQAMREEEKNYETEEAQNSGKHQISETLLKYPHLAVKSADVGYEINLADVRMASLLNSDGMVRIGDFIYQYTKQYNKAIRDVATQSNEIELLKAGNVTDAGKGLFVGKNIIKTHELQNNLRTDGSGDPFATRSCDVSDGGSPQEYRLITYEESVYMEESVGGAYNLQMTVSQPTIKPDGTVSSTPVQYTVVNQSGKVYYSVHQVKVRTLKRGIFGSWNSFSTGMQSVQGNFSLQGITTYAWSQFGVLNASLSYYETPDSGSTTDTFTVTLAESQKFTSPADAYNVRFTSSSQHRALWTRDGKTCDCKINY